MHPQTQGRDVGHPRVGHWTFGDVRVCTRRRIRKRAGSHTITGAVECEVDGEAPSEAHGDARASATDHEWDGCRHRSVGRRVAEGCV